MLRFVLRRLLVMGPLVFLALSVILFVRGRRERGLGQFRQAGALSLVAAGIFTAIGLDLVHF